MMQINDTNFEYLTVIDPRMFQSSERYDTYIGHYVYHIWILILRAEYVKGYKNR